MHAYWDIKFPLISYSLQKETAIRMMNNPIIRLTVALTV